MNTALNPNVTPLLIYAAIALVVLFSFVAAILVILGRVRTWLRAAFQEFTESVQFEATIQRILDRVADKMMTRVEVRFSLLETRDAERADAVKRAHGRVDDALAQLAIVKQQSAERIDKLFDRVTDIVERMPAKGSPP